MKDLSTGLSTWARTVASIINLIGVGDACRFYPVGVQDSIELPYALFTVEKDEEPLTHGNAASLASAMVSIECYGKDTSEANALAQTFQDALTNPPFSGLMGDVQVYQPAYKGGSPAYQWTEQEFMSDVNFKFWYSLA